ncbi:hypothetical protein JRO89_XS10G0081000 [Xanthoceras sorbifolium]|uniref:Benzyl alcohol O-benzoyltransferase n=1 Tax=Xanthoceras sorbifolium TaxID=99658 RepID=A0ABQ8HI44_9ROSI|nr:hypothetical protein JRO89_XS10G0081000 [Xanthoceras sorbifolium]
MASIPCQAFSVIRKAPKLIVPTRRGSGKALKQLSDIDYRQGLRFQVPLIFFDKNNPSMEGKDPVTVIKEALSKALVFYNPSAGRLGEGLNGKLMVDCTDEGVLFTEADANVTLDQLGDEIQPPSPYLDQLLKSVPSSDAIIGCPSLSFQVTRLICGGIILALRFNHTICDAYGLIQFLKVMEEMVQAMDPNDNNHKSFFFGHREIQALRDRLLVDLRSCSTFELITACIWKCRTTSLELDSDEIVRVSCVVKVREKNYNMDLPPGYYGNAFAYPAVCTKAHILCENPLGYAVELVKETKAKMSEEYIRSMADLLVIRGRPRLIFKGNFIVSDNSRISLEKLILVGVNLSTVELVGLHHSSASM